MRQPIVNLLIIICVLCFSAIGHSSEAAGFKITDKDGNIFIVTDVSGWTKHSDWSGCQKTGILLESGLTIPYKSIKVFDYSNGIVIETYGGSTIKGRVKWAETFLYGKTEFGKFRMNLHHIKKMVNLKETSTKQSSLKDGNVEKEPDQRKVEQNRPNNDANLSQLTEDTSKWLYSPSAEKSDEGLQGIKQYGLEKATE